MREILDRISYTDENRRGNVSPEPAMLRSKVGTKGGEGVGREEIVCSNLIMIFFLSVIFKGHRNRY